jgi:hypothetical protein
MKSEGARSWVSSYCFRDVSDALLVLALPGVEFASFLPAIGALWIEPNPCAYVRNCLVKVPLSRKSQSAIMKSFGVCAAWRTGEHLRTRGNAAVRVTVGKFALLPGRILSYSRVHRHQSDGPKEENCHLP